MFKIMFPRVLAATSAQASVHVKLIDNLTELMDNLIRLHSFGSDVTDLKVKLSKLNAKCIELSDETLAVASTAQYAKTTDDLMGIINILNNTTVETNTVISEIDNLMTEINNKLAAI